MPRDTEINSKVRESHATQKGVRSHLSQKSLCSCRENFQSLNLKHKTSTQFNGSIKFFLAEKLPARKNLPPQKVVTTTWPHPHHHHYFPPSKSWQSQKKSFSPSALASAALPVFVAAIVAVVLIPDDSAGLVAVQVVVAGALTVGAAGLVVGSVVLDGLQEADWVLVNCISYFFCQPIVYVYVCM